MTGFDTVTAPDGLPLANSAQEAATGQAVVITMLPNGSILNTVAGEILSAMSKGALLLDCSTVDVEAARAVADQAAKHGVLAADAPVSGGIGGAANGTLTFMAGGSDAAFAKAEP